MSNKFVEENRDFVLKVTLECSNEDDRQTRRVKLPRIVDSTGKVSYEELVGLVIRLSFPTMNDALLSNKKKFHKVKLTYHDVDSDLIYLGSTEELMDAFEQYSEQRFVRINAKVERRRSPQQQQQQKQQKKLYWAENNLINVVTGASPVAATVSLTSPSLPPQTHVTSNTDSNQIDQKLIEKVLIKILRSASVAIHGSNSSTASDLLVPVSSKEEQKNKAAAKGPEEEVIHVIKSDAHGEHQAAGNHVKQAVVRGELKQTPPNGKVKIISSGNSIHNIVNSNNKKENNVNKINLSDNDMKNTAKKDQDKDKDKKEQEKPSFIHMRHTCDLCLVTPIIGNRYHATNLPDYDLCENCHNSYGGNEIQFEVVMLDQDRYLQGRWQELLRWPRTCQQTRFLRLGKRDLQSSDGSPRHCGNAIPPLRAQANKCTEFEMKEAIQRSLEDDNINRNVEEKSNKTEKQIAAKKLPVYLQPPQISAKKEDDAASAYTDENELSFPCKVKSCHACSEASPSIAENEEKKPVYTKLTRKYEDNGNRSKIGIKSQHKEVKTEVINEQNGDKEKKDTYDKTPTQVERDTSLEKKPVTHQEEKSTESNLQNSSEEDKCREKDNSFSSDADGNGIVAGILGETLDKFANGIDEMVMEIHRISSEDNNKKSEQHEVRYFNAGEEEESLINSGQEINKVSNTSNNAVTTKHATGKKGKYSATILESVKNPHGDKVDGQADEVATGDNTVDDWQVVNENKIDIAQIEDTEAIAFATQFIGSSLFDSGMDSHDSREEDKMSVLSGCSISTVSSVPKNLASSITTIASAEIYLEHASIYQRWEPQLLELKEIGFPVKLCVGVLEKLEAANIGVEALNEENTVTQVLNEFFK